jgi:hypothetical protein
MDTTKFGLDDLSDESLKARKELQTKEIKVASKDTLINRWNAGKRVTEKQMEYLKSTGVIDVTEIKSIIVQTPVFDKETLAYMGLKPVTKFFNKSQVRIDNAVKEDILTNEEMVMSNSRYLEANASEHEAKNVDINHARAELSATKAVAHAREEIRIAAEMKKRNFVYLSRKEIYEKAVAAQKLLISDMQENTFEQPPA